MAERAEPTAGAETLFERAVEAKARLLKAERLGAVGRDEREAPAFLLTLDVGRILVSADALSGRLDALHIPTPEEVPSGLVPSDEDEPWWRLLGAPLHRCEIGRRRQCDPSAVPVG